jgi:predicted negative regulator of RcsB-dependent stress response
MSEIYESDDDQVDALKKWWDENGKTTVLGLVIGLSAVFGWTAWQSYQLAQSEAASSLYAQLVNAARDDRGDDVQARADTILAEFPNSGYAVLATLYLARSAVQADRRDEAKARLEWVLANATLDAYKHVARLRLARLALDAKDLASAKTRLDVSPALKEEDAFFASFVALRGDIARAEGNAKEARVSFEQALKIVGKDSPRGARISMKLADLGTWNIEP